MESAVAPGYMAVPFDPSRGDPERITLMLDTFCENPSWMTLPVSPEIMRVVAARILTDPENDIREVWRGGRFVGVLVLTNITPGVDALCHFVFFDQSLIGKRTLIRNWLGDCFRDYQLQRITLEVPEDIEVLVSFARRKLGFKYEGEDGLRAALPQETSTHDGNTIEGKTLNRILWHFARLCSRKERAHFHNGAWHDIVRLRILRDEQGG